MLQTASRSTRQIDRKAAKDAARLSKAFPSRTLASNGVVSLLDRWFTEGRQDVPAYGALNTDSGDRVFSYFAMRKSSLGRAPDGGLRPLLNNAFVFQTGMLDQVGHLEA